MLLRARAGSEEKPSPVLGSRRRCIRFSGAGMSSYLIIRPTFYHRFVDQDHPLSHRAPRRPLRPTSTSTCPNGVCNGSRGRKTGHSSRAGGRQPHRDLAPVAPVQFSPCRSSTQAVPRIDKFGSFWLAGPPSKPPPLPRGLCCLDPHRPPLVQALRSRYACIGHQRQTTVSIKQCRRVGHRRGDLAGHR